MRGIPEQPESVPGEPETAPSEDALVGATLETLRRAVEDVEAERSMAEALQRSLLAERLPEVVGLRLAARYLPGGLAGPVGGDWYDVAALPEGRVALAIGDVVGHGVNAAARMARLQSALRAYTLEGTDPGAALDRMNAFVREDAGAGMATVLSAVVDPEAYTIRYASAGHLAPLVITPSGEPGYLSGTSGSPLGVVEFPVYDEMTAALEPGSTLVLFTDGLVERREGSLNDGLAELSERARGAGLEPEALCDTLLARMLGGAPPRDDVAVLAVHLLPEPGPEMSVRLTALPASLAGARRELARWLRARGTGEAETYEVLVAAGEACANAVAHAYPAGQEGWFELTAAENAGVVTITVRDYGEWRPPRPEPSRGLVIMRELMQSVDVETDARGTVVRMVRSRSAAKEEA